MSNPNDVRTSFYARPPQRETLERREEDDLPPRHVLTVGTPHVPRVGERVTIEGDPYRVEGVTWQYPDGLLRAASVVMRSES